MQDHEDPLHPRMLAILSPGEDMNPLKRATMPRVQVFRNVSLAGPGGIIFTGEGDSVA